MRTTARLILAVLLITTTAASAAAQTQRRNQPHQRVQPAQGSPNLTSDPYGERSTSPGAVPCSQRPFAPGCDKRGFW